LAVSRAFNRTEDVHRVAIEFPSDNPDLWTNRAPLAALAILFAEEAADEPETETAAEAETVAETETAAEKTETVSEPELEVIEFDESDFAAIENESIPPPAQPDAFQVYVRTLIEVALAAGSPGRVVEILPAMLGLARLDVQALDENAIDALVSSCLLARSESGAVVRHDAFVAAAQAWRATLLGEDADFSACPTMLDEWSANLIATLAGVPNQREALRRDLRARGIAAFGIAA
jgi:hypothetical protein